MLTFYSFQVDTMKYIYINLDLNSICTLVLLNSEQFACHDLMAGYDGPSICDVFFFTACEKQLL